MIAGQGGSVRGRTVTAGQAPRAPCSTSTDEAPELRVPGRSRVRARMPAARMWVRTGAQALWALEAHKTAPPPGGEDDRSANTDDGRDERRARQEEARGEREVDRCACR